MRDLFLESEAAEPVQANRVPALRAGLSRPIHVSGYDRKVGDFYATPDWRGNTVPTRAPGTGHDEEAPR